MIRFVPCHTNPSIVCSLAFSLMVLVSLLQLPAHAKQAAHPRRSLPLSASIELEMGVLASPVSNQRRDLAGLFTLPLRVYIHLGFQWQLSAGLGIPVPIPGRWAAQVPIALHWQPAGVTNGGVGLHLGVRGLLSGVEVCATGPASACPIEALPSRNPYHGVPYNAYGLAGEAGVSWSFRLHRVVLLRLAASYISGPMWGLGLSGANPIAGWYQGGLFSSGVVHDL